MEKPPQSGSTTNDPGKPRPDQLPTVRAASPPGLSASDAVGEARFASGTLLAERYRIVAPLGAGGMGEVYRADDLKLGQVVALKFLPRRCCGDATWLARLRNEVRLARGIAHPNICRVYDIGEADGEHFISMEYIDGEDLASLLRRIGRLAKDKALQIARQLCAALAAAHERSVLHRDLKPANIMLDGRGQVRITDFGIAALTEQVNKQETVIGTPAYMSPEQLAGTNVSVRSDIYSLGLVLYEIFTGEPVFGGHTITQVRRLHEHAGTMEPSNFPDDVDPIVRRVIVHCLKKDANKRPSSALAVESALSASASPQKEVRHVTPQQRSESREAAGPETVFDRPAVAVLPFANMSGELDQEYFADGITEDIVTALSYWRWFPVIARNSTFVYKGKAANIKHIGKELGARYVLEGSVRKVGSRVRISAQLVDAATGHHLWAQRYDRDLSDIFELQDEISARIVASIEPELERIEQQRALRKTPENLDAWDYCLRALAVQSQSTKRNFSEARHLLLEAAKLDPASSRALSMLSRCQYEEAMHGLTDDPAGLLAESFRAADQAVALDDGDWLAHNMLGMGHLWTQRDYDRGVHENERAIALNPSAAPAYHGLACLLDFSGRWAEAIPQLHTVMRLDPRYQHAHVALSDLALSHLMLRDFQSAVPFAEKAIRVLPSYVRARQRLASCLGHMDCQEDARAAMAELLELQPGFSQAYIDATYPFKNPEDRDFFIAGLRKAGLST